MQLVGANSSAEPVGDVQLPGRSNYFIGNDPAKWHRDIPQFARVRYRNVYPGVDLVYYGNQGQLEYDFEVAPGSDPGQVALRFQNLANHSPKNPRIVAGGDLVLDVAGSDVRLRAPRVYQKFGAEERIVAGRFELRGQKKDEVGFELGDYDRSQTLIIDPVLAYSTYLGGTGAESCSAITGLPFTPGCPAIAVDAASNAYVAGSTTSTNFPQTTGEFQPELAAGATANVFIAKFNPTGTLLFATYLGGNGTDYAAGVATDTGFDVIVAGTASSGNFPTTDGPNNTAFQTTPVSGGKHVFVSKLDPTGRILLYSTYLSGHGIDIASGLAVDQGGQQRVCNRDNHLRRRGDRISVHDRSLSNAAEDTRLESILLHQGGSECERLCERTLFDLLRRKQSQYRHGRGRRHRGRYQLECVLYRGYKFHRHARAQRFSSDEQGRV